MDVYFCDICGVRVTDVDLRGGHGMRRGHDVICAGCLDLGHGKDWMDHHREAVAAVPAAYRAAQGFEANGAAAAIPATMSLGASAPDSPTLDAARDRARTLDEDLPAPQAVMAQPVAVSAPSEFASDTEGAAPIQDEPELPSTPEAPAVSALEQTAATHMASLTEPAPVEPDQLDAVLADIDAVAIVAKTPLPARPGKPVTAKTGSKTSSNRVPAAKAGSGPNASAKKVKGDDKGKRSDPRPATSVKSKSGRVVTTKRNKSSNTGMLLMISGLSLAIIVVGGIGLIANKTKPAHAASSGVITDRLAELKTALAAAKASGVAALNSKDRAQLEAANRQLVDLNGRAIAFEAEAKKQGLTEEQIGDYLENIQFSYTRSLSKNIRDELVKQAMQH